MGVTQQQQYQHQQSFVPTQLQQQSREEAEPDPFAAPFVSSSSSSSGLDINRVTSGTAGIGLSTASPTVIAMSAASTLPIAADDDDGDPFVSAGSSLPYSGASTLNNPFSPKPSSSGHYSETSPNSNNYGGEDEEEDDPFAVAMPAKGSSAGVNTQQTQQQGSVQQVREGEGSFPSLDEQDCSDDQDYVHISRPSPSVPTNEESWSAAAPSFTATSPPQVVANTAAVAPAAPLSTSSSAAATSKTSFHPGGAHSHNVVTTPAVNISIAGFSLDQERLSRIEALTQWIKTNAPDIRIDLAITYADLFYQVTY